MLVIYFIAFPSIMIGGISAAMTSTFLSTTSKPSKTLEDDYPTLVCGRCQEKYCSRRDRLNCRGGYTLDVCGCCITCAILEGQLCGGDFRQFGKCDRGLACVPNLELQKRYGNQKPPVGLCERDPWLVAEQPIGLHCKQPCTPEFCAKNPRAICSAIDNVEKPQDCQGECQHTSCSACRFISSRPDCPKCSTDDFACMRKFARCVKKHLCRRATRALPCKRSETSKYEGYFQCIVPECS